MTLTQTLACRRSGAVSTCVTVTNPTRGSATSRDRISLISWRSSSSMRSVRWVIRRVNRQSQRDDVRNAIRASCLTDRDPADGLAREALDDVALLEVVEVRQGDAALEVGGDLANVVP